MTRYNGKLFYLLKLIFSVLLVSYLVGHTSVSEICRNISSSNWAWLVAAIFLMNFRFIFAALRWRLLLRSIGYKIATLPLLISYLEGMLVGILIPSGVGCDVYRASATRNSIPMSTNFGVIFFERLLGFVALALFSIPSILQRENTTIAYYGILAICCTILPACTLYFVIKSFSPTKFTTNNNLIQKFLSKIVNTAQGAKSLGNDFMTLFNGTLLSLLFFLPAVVAPWFVAKSINADIPLSIILIILPVIWVISLLPLTIQGVGLHEGTFVYLLSLAGVNKQLATTVSLLWLGIRMLAIVVGGASLIIPNTRKEKMGFSDMGFDKTK